MGQKVVLEKASWKMMMYTRTFYGDRLSAVYTVLIKNISLGSLSLGGFSRQLGIQMWSSSLH